MNVNMSELIAALAAKTQEENTDTSIMEVIYDHYAEFHGYGDPKSKEYFNALMAMMENRSAAEQDLFVDLINMLCSVHEHTGFVDGVKSGVRLLCELIV